MNLPWLLISCGIMKLGSRTPPDGPSNRKRSVATSVFSGRSGSSRQSGSSRSRPIGSNTMPERICAPTSEPFSTTTTDRPASSSLSRIAAARPAGPAPTTTTSNSIASRAGSSSSPAICPCFPVLARGRPAPPRNADPNCANRRRLSIPPSSAPTGMLEAAIPRRARFAMASSNRSTPLSAAAAAETLRWWIEAGVDLALDETAHDRFAESAAPAPRRAPAAIDGVRRADGLLRGAARAGGGRRARRSGALGARQRRRRGDARRACAPSWSASPVAG